MNPENFNITSTIEECDQNEDLGWDEAIRKVLSLSDQPMHYTEISEEIKNQKLRKRFGATPANTVNAVICTSINNERDKSSYIRVDRGTYWLKSKLDLRNVASESISDPDAGSAAGTGLINAFGMYWSRDKVDWGPTQPPLLGMQQFGSDSVDFCNQKGVYLLLDGRAVVYVGRTTDRPLGVRLREHLSDRLNSRWDRFSWFGIYEANSEGKLNTNATSALFDFSLIIATMEALLIEGLEPPQNRKRGDDFTAVEFLQAENPEIEKKRHKAIISGILDKM